LTRQRRSSIHRSGGCGKRVVASPAFVASLVDAIDALREIMIASAQVSRAGIRREGFSLD
jgi:hypothetical protein